MKLHFRFFFIAALVVGCTPQLVLSPRSTATSSSPSETPQITVPIENSGTLVAPTPIWDDDFLIAYIKYVEDLQYSGGNELYIINSTRNHQINVFEGLSGTRAWGFSWSPSGEWLLFGEYDQVSQQGETNEQSLHFNLWAVRSNGTQRHKVMRRAAHSSINWAKNKDLFLIHCSFSQGDSEICIVNPENGQIIKTGNIGRNAQFSPDGRKYAYIQSQKEIFIANTSDHKADLLFLASGDIPGFSWTQDQASIITAVENRSGCGDKKDGSTTILQVKLSTKETKALREIEWSLSRFKFELAPSEDHLLSSWYLCGENVDILHGVIGIRNDHIMWPLHNFANYEWTNDGKFLIQEEWGTGHRYFLDPLTGQLVGSFEPPFLQSLLTAEDRQHNVNIFWSIQPTIK